MVSALGLGGWWAWPIVFPALPDGWLSTLAKADAALVQNRFDGARAVLEKIPPSLPVAGWLQWEKRVQAVASATGAWKWASETAAAAQAQYPGNPDLAAYLTWTLLQDGRPAEASRVAARTLPGTAWEGLAVQASIEAAGLASGDWAGFRQTLAEPSEASFQLYERLLTLSSDPLLRKNALLSALSRGDLDSARDHLGVLTPDQRDLPPFDRLQGLLAYDQGDWARAAALLKRLPHNRPENLLVLADVYLHLGDPVQAEWIYDQLLADSGEEPPVSLIVNRATLALDRGEPAQALALLEASPSLQRAPEGDRIRLLILEARFALGESAAVLRSLVSLLEEGGESDRALEAELLKDRLFPDLVSVPRLWSLLHRHPAHGPLAERLAWLQLEAQDQEGALRALDLHRTALEASGQKEPWWSHFLRALILASENRLEEADRSFAQVPPAWRSAVFYADWALNAAVLAQQTGDQRKPWLDSGHERLTRALDLLPPSQSPEALHRRSLWLTRRGELATALIPLELPALRGSLRSAATEDFRQAVQLDDDNLRASFLLRQTLAVTQEKP